MKIDLSDVNLNSELFCCSRGLTKVTEIINRSEERFETEDETRYYVNGHEYNDDTHPSIFHSIDECIEYFQSVKKEMDEASKPKKRYWIWNYKPKEELGYWSKCNSYLDDNGMTTSGYYLFGSLWDSFEKEKLEDRFIDV